MKIVLKRFILSVLEDTKLGKGQKKYKKNVKNVWNLKISAIFALRNVEVTTQVTPSGCSSARLEYTSGGRVVAGSNPVTPTS